MRSDAIDVTALNAPISKASATSAAGPRLLRAVRDRIRTPTTIRFSLPVMLRCQNDRAVIIGSLC
jgi:hypothetical protein